MPGSPASDSPPLQGSRNLSKCWEPKGPARVCPSGAPRLSRGRSREAGGIREQTKESGMGRVCKEKGPDDHNCWGLSLLLSLHRKIRLSLKGFLTQARSWKNLEEIRTIFSRINGREIGMCYPPLQHTAPLPTLHIPPQQEESILQAWSSVTTSPHSAACPCTAHPPLPQHPAKTCTATAGDQHPTPHT